MPMGCSSSCRTFETFSTAVEWIALEKLLIDKLLHLLDDFLIISSTYFVCKAHFDLFIILCDFLGIPIAPDKIFGPSTTLTFTGIELDVISQNRDLPDSIDQIRTARKEIHAIFHQYQTTWLSYMDFLAHGNTTECKGEQETMDSIMNNRKQFLQTVLMEFEELKKDILLEMGSRRSSSRASSVSSAALRAQARAEVAAAIKKVEMQKRRSSVETQSILLIHQQEMALA